MRTALAILVLLSACSTEPLAGVPRVVLGVAKQEVAGAWSYHAVVVSSDPATGVSAGDERRFDVDFEIYEYELVARRLGDAAEVMTLRIESHFDVERRLDPVTGETTTVVRESGDSPWHERGQMRVDVAMQHIVDPAFVPIPTDAEPLEYSEPFTDEVTWLPSTDTTGRATWSLLSQYDAPGGRVVVRHELARIDD